MIAVVILEDVSDRISHLFLSVSYGMTGLVFR